MYLNVYIPALVIFNILLYWRTISYGYVIDDIDWQRIIRPCLSNKDITPPNRIMYAIYGSLPIPVYLDHAITLTLHIITVLLISAISPIAALLFSAHPCNHQTAVWLNGRRYSVLNITFLAILITHTYYLFIPLVLIITRFGITQLSARKYYNVPRGTFNTISILNTIRLTLWRLSGIPQYAFRYPYQKTAPFLPRTQPIAERYLSIPLIITCIALAKVPFICAIMPLYVFRTAQLIPMYANIQSFYDYHRFLYPHLEKLNHIATLYKEIKT
jgi:hypothetical protein